MRRLTYENMTAALVRELPELKPYYDRELKRWGEEMGQHVMYRYVLYSAIEDALKKAPEDDVFLKRAFVFLESLIDHPEAHVKEVAHQSVCDKICADEIILQKAQKHMGRRTKRLCAAIASTSERNS